MYFKMGRGYILDIGLGVDSDEDLVLLFLLNRFQDKFNTKRVFVLPC